jgi:hypothetical protein
MVFFIVWAWRLRCELPTDAIIISLFGWLAFGNHIFTSLELTSGSMTWNGEMAVLLQTVDVILRTKVEDCFVAIEYKHRLYFFA